MKANDLERSLISDVTTEVTIHADLMPLNLAFITRLHLTAFDHV